MPEHAPEELQLREMHWRDWRRLTRLFLQLFPELSRQEVAGLILQPEDTIVVAELKREIVGFYHCIPKPEQGKNWLNYVGVVPPHTRRGIATRLLQDYERRTLQQGFRLAELDVLQHNQNAIQFYEQHGYQQQPLRQLALPGKFRYRKQLPAPIGSSPAAPRSLPRLARLGRRLLYLALVGLPRPA